MNSIINLWRGDVPLPKTFWIFGLGVNILFDASLFYLDSHVDQWTSIFGQIAYLSVLLVFVIYSPFILIAIWQSANKYQGLQRYVIAAKIVVIVGWVHYLKGFVEIAREFSKW